MSSVVVDAVLQVEELLNTVLLVLAVSVIRLLLGSGDTLNTLLEVVLEAVADTLGSGLTEGRVGILGLILVLLVLFFFFFFFLLSLLGRCVGSLLFGSLFNGFGLEWSVSKCDLENVVCKACPRDGSKGEART